MKLEFKNPWRGLRGLPTDVWIVFATSLVNRAGMMALPFLILYLTKHLNVPESIAGLALTAYGVGGVVTSPIAGRLSDRVGPFTVMRASLACTGVLLLVFPLIHNFALFVAMSFLWAVSDNATRPATLSALTETTSPEQRKAAIAVNRLGVNLGMSIGPAVGGFLAAVSFPMLFVVDGLTSLAASGVLTALLWSQRDALAVTHENAIARGLTASKAREKLEGNAGRSMYRDWRAMAFFGAMILIGLVFMQHQGIMPLYLVQQLHYKESFYGLLFMLNTLIIVAVEVPLNLAMSKWSHRNATLLGLGLVTLGFSGIGLFSGVPGIVATTIVWTFGEMILFPVATVYVADLAPEGRTGEYMGGYTSTFSLSMILGPWAGTAVLAHYGSTVAWSAVFVCGVAAVATLAFTPRGHAVADEDGVLRHEVGTTV